MAVQVSVLVTPKGAQTTLTATYSTGNTDTRAVYVKADNGLGVAAATRHLSATRFTP
jgi:hypothetical protein